MAVRAVEKGVYSSYTPGNAAVIAEGTGLGEAGNLALKMMVTGGVYLGGGIAPKIIGKLQGERFMQGFRSKGRMQSLLESMPVRVILNDSTALFGPALYGALSGNE